MTFHAFNKFSSGLNVTYPVVQPPPPPPLKTPDLNRVMASKCFRSICYQCSEINLFGRNKTRHTQKEKKVLLSTTTKSLRRKHTIRGTWNFSSIKQIALCNSYKLVLDIFLYTQYFCFVLLICFSVLGCVQLHQMLKNN